MVLARELWGAPEFAGKGLCRGEGPGEEGTGWQPLFCNIAYRQLKEGPSRV